MGKKKVKDFNKIKLKLGKTLKRQKDTVVDLSKRKILLPREKDHVKHNSCREPNDVLQECVERLKSSSESLQLSALSFIQSVLLPYSAQICADWNSRPLVYCNEKSLKSLNNLFGYNKKQDEMALQFGDLFESVDRLCRHSTSGQVPAEIAKLCALITTIFSVNPRIFSGAFALDIISLSLLHRSEFWFRAAGVEVLSDLMEARHRILTSLICAADCFSPFSKIDELKMLIDVRNYSNRRSVCTRLLIRHFESLHENRAFAAISSRKILLKAIMKYLRDIQYTLFITPIVLSSFSSMIRLHPFLHTLKPSSHASVSAHVSTDACLSSTWMLQSSNPILDKLSDTSISMKDNYISKEKSFQPPIRAQEGLDPDSRLVFYVLRESHFLIDELVHNPSEGTVFGLIYAIRFLKTFLEMNTDFLTLADSQSSLDIPTSLLRFASQLCELVPPDCAGDALVPDMVASSANSVGRGGGVGLSRKKLKKNSKRVAKLARRQASKQGAEDTTTGSDQDLPRPSQVAGQPSHSGVLSHLLKQQILQLVWTLAADDSAFEFNTFPLMIKDFALSLASFLLATTVQKGSTMPALTFLNSSSPALAWRWIHTIDFCLLYSTRIRRLSPKRLDSLRCLTTPMVVALAYIVHHWCHRQISPISTSKSSPRAPRIVIRAAGILMAFLHGEFERQRFGPPVDINSSRMDSSWVKTRMDTFNEVSLPPGMENPLETFVTDLCDIVERGSVESANESVRWIWAAACLSSLAEIRCPNVCERIESSLRLGSAVTAMKDWDRGPAILEDPLINLPSPWTATYPSAKSWKCVAIGQIYAQDVTTG